MSIMKSNLISWMEPLFHEAERERERERERESNSAKEEQQCIQFLKQPSGGNPLTCQQKSHQKLKSNSNI